MGGGICGALCWFDRGMLGGIGGGVGMVVDVGRRLRRFGPMLMLTMMRIGGLRYSSQRCKR